MPNEHWSLDFMSDTRSSGRRIRTLSVLDTCTREALAIAVDTSLPSQAVTRLLGWVIQTRQRPQQIRLDNGPELTSNWFDQWASNHGITLDYISSRPGGSSTTGNDRMFTRLPNPKGGACPADSTFRRIYDGSRILIMIGSNNGDRPGH